jgi:hypothetical protein
VWGTGHWVGMVDLPASTALRSTRATDGLAAVVVGFVVADSFCSIFTTIWWVQIR